MHGEYKSQNTKSKKQIRTRYQKRKPNSAQGGAMKGISKC
jgi:hypothetical protein